MGKNRKRSMIKKSGIKGLLLGWAVAVGIVVLLLLIGLIGTWLA